MPKNYLIIGLKKIHVEKVEELESGLVIVFGKFKGRKQCPHCQSCRVQSRGWRKRRLKHSRMGNRIVEVIFGSPGQEISAHRICACFAQIRCSWDRKQN